MNENDEDDDIDDDDNDDSLAYAKIAPPVQAQEFASLGPNAGFASVGGHIPLFVGGAQVREGVPHSRKPRICSPPIMGRGALCGKLRFTFIGRCSVHFLVRSG